MDIVLERSFIRNYEKFKQQLRIFYSQIPKSLSFFFFKDFCKKTQADKVYWHLQEFGSITNLQCHAIYGIRHAPSVIRDIRARLRLQGNKYKIENRTKKGCNCFGQPCNWNEYTLVPTEGGANDLPMSA